MTSKLSLFAAALAVLGGGATQAHAYDGGYLPPPAYAYSGYDYGAAGAGEECGGDSFTLAGAHAGVTVLGVDLSGGARLSIGDQGVCHRHHHVRYAARGYAPPPPQPVYQQPAYAPPPMPYPCGCEQRPQGW